MEYIHVKNLEKYHPGYKDRKLIWAKIFFNMVQGDPDCEMIENETDWARLIKFIILELQARKPIPLSDKYLIRKGFDLKKRSISLTIKELHEFIEIHQETVTEPLQSCNVEKRREEKSNVTDFLDYFNLKTNKKLTLTEDRKNIIKKRLSDGYSFEQLKKAVDNFIQDDWPDRYKHIDIIYCIGKQRGKPDNLEKWLNQSTKHTNKSLAYD